MTQPPPGYPHNTFAARQSAGAATAATISPKKFAASKEPRESSVKETIESILVAFILAFVFRAFVVEAFVIPTGSMAPTLLGAHMRFRCNDCGYAFAANFSPDQQGDDLYIPPRSPYTYRVFCPNCGYRLPQVDPDSPDNGTEKPQVHYGDRILVLKYLYLFEDPQRWDVVVFKSPDIRVSGDRGYSATASTYQQNYIKRLVGKPNESVMLLDGDVYIGQPGQEPENFTIQTKPRYVQDALWRVIYDNDYVPRKLMRNDGSKWEQPWRVRDASASGWTIGDAPTPVGRTFRFNNAAGESTICFDRNANPIAERAAQEPKPYAFTDWLAYDVEHGVEHNNVHDLKLSFVYQRSAGDGPLRAKVTTGEGNRKHEFVAVISGVDAQLIHRSAAGEARIGQAMPLSKGDRPLRVELTNVDYEVTLRVDGMEVARTTSNDYKPDVPRLLADYAGQVPQPLPTVEITAANQTAALSHVGLWRDIYYINRQIPGGSGWLYWGTPAKLPDSIMRLGADEFFVLGDNSLISGDARYWHVPIDLPADQLSVQSGRVPARFMLGRAFFVYWPAGFRPASRLPGLAPDFGDMRFIR
jgi:signal peptidase I